jgi:hypothetical protein
MCCTMINNWGGEKRNKVFGRRLFVVSVKRFPKTVTSKNKTGAEQ